MEEPKQNQTKEVFSREEKIEMESFIKNGPPPLLSQGDKGKDKSESNLARTELEFEEQKKSRKTPKQELLQELVNLYAKNGEVKNKGQLKVFTMEELREKIQVEKEKFEKRGSQPISQPTHSSNSQSVSQVPQVPSISNPQDRKKFFADSMMNIVNVGSSVIEKGSLLLENKNINLEGYNKNVMSKEPLLKHNFEKLYQDDPSLEKYLNPYSQIGLILGASALETLTLNHKKSSLNSES